MAGGEVVFRAKECSDGKWHVWCSKQSLIARNALVEPPTITVLFEFDRSKQQATNRLWEQIRGSKF